MLSYGNLGHTGEGEEDQAICPPPMREAGLSVTEDTEESSTFLEMNQAKDWTRTEQAKGNVHFTGRVRSSNKRHKRRPGPRGGGDRLSRQPAES